MEYQNIIGNIVLIIIAITTFNKKSHAILAQWPFSFFLGDVVDDKPCSYGTKSVFLRGRSNVLLRLKYCSQYCNAIEKDRSLGRE